MTDEQKTTNNEKKHKMATSMVQTLKRGGILEKNKIM